MTEQPQKPPARIHLTWAGEHRFDTGRPGGPTARLDGSGVTGQSPVDGLVSALAACTSVDVVDILAKRRTPVTRLEIDAVGERVDTIPRRLKRVVLNYTIDGEGINREQALRAIELAVTKYCSVRDSLDPNMPVEWTLTLNGEADPRA